MQRKKTCSDKHAAKSNTYLQDFWFLLKNCRFHLIAPYINAFVVSFGFLSASDLTDFFSIDTTLVFLFSSILTGAIYSLNNTYDVESDKKQLQTAKDFGRWNLSTKNQVALGNISKRMALSFSAFLFCLSTLYFYVKGGALPAFFATIIFIWGWAYSAPPLKLKNRFLLDLLLHGLFWGSFLFLMGFSVKRVADLNIVMSHLVLIFFSSLLWQFHNFFEDYYADKEAGNMTFVVRLGLKKSFYLYVLLLGIAVTYSIFLIPVTWSTVAFLCAITLYLASGLKVAKENTFRVIFLPRKHFHLANLFLFLWIAMSVYFR